ncbi:hypothetical protein OCK74_05665 [Chitinophagaceae bacterium LB-8]|uniref:Tetratricopeptide repeat protein n=1 Tax=Paraflavisolibacter caeni TaxID=2982496 RepID=A0A9X2XNF1_9BACT|nr:DUF6624 domain-containing protein [Paraflavisolibacter caeni]MCU7548593.1 hypothetical protein [Paraflavisolibacter caeni]
MKKLSIFCCCLLLFFSTNAQSDSVYQTLIGKASLFHLQENYKSAIECYEQAFKLQNPDALTAYKAAGMYSLDSNADRALIYLQIALKSGWTEADRLAFDPYFDYLRKTEQDKWKAIEQEALTKEQQYGKTLQLPSLRKEINLMALKDQQLRYKRVQTNNDNLLAIINGQINQSDLNNLERAKQIISQYGWLKISQIGKDGQNNLWLIVQHADQDVMFQQTALTAMEKLKGTKELNMENYAFLYDRVQCNLNYKQVYGTQVVWTNNGEASGVRPVKEEDKVDERRKEIGLQPLQIYALTYGFNYKVPTTAQARQNDSAESINVHLLMDSAKYFYSKREFQKTYDYYNTASTFLSGMSSADNFDAAIVFSKIGAVDKDEKYKSIALDFLNLLYVRQNLTKTQLLSQPAFKVLYKEPRWKDMIKQLN